MQRREEHHAYMSNSHTPISGRSLQKLVNSLIALVQWHSFDDGLDVMEGSKMEHLPHLCTPANTASHHPAASVNSFISSCLFNQHLVNSFSMPASAEACLQLMVTYDLTKQTRTMPWTLIATRQCYEWKTTSALISRQSP